MFNASFKKWAVACACLALSGACAALEPGGSDDIPGQQKRPGAALHLWAYPDGAVPGGFDTLLWDSRSAGTADQPVEVTDAAVSGFAQGYADLRTGKIGVLTQSSGAPWVAVEAGFSERLALAISGASDTTVTRLHFQWEAHGYFNNVGPNSIIATLLTVEADLGSGPGYQTRTERIDLRADNVGNANGTGNTDLANLPTSYSSCRADNRCTALGPWSYRSFVDVVGASPTLSIGTYLYAGLAGGGLIDLSRTGAFSFVDLPAEVSFSSSSGVFLTPVPETGAAHLLLLGLGALAVCRRWIQGRGDRASTA